MGCESLPSKLLYYDGKKVRTRTLQGFLRALAWDHQDRYLIVVGNRGRVLRIEKDRIISLDSGTRSNLRAVSVNPIDGTALIVGNTGAALILNDQQRFTSLNVPSFQNLRSVSWHQNGTVALVAGNNGTLFKYSREEFETVEAGRANLRDISWRPNTNTALISSNCFAEEFIPSPNLFDYDTATGMVKPMNEGRADLIGVDWKPTGESALVVGYDVVWHNGLIGNFDGTLLSPIQFDNKLVYPVAAAWKTSDNLAAIVTATPEPGTAKGMVFLWDNRSMKSIYTDDDHFFSDIAWTHDGTSLTALASTQTRTFNS